jgi:hypothetical protein
MSFRHRKVVPIEEIQVALGHKNLKSSMAYRRISTDEADTARASAFAQAASGQLLVKAEIFSGEMRRRVARKDNLKFWEFVF